MDKDCKCRVVSDRIKEDDDIVMVKRFGVHNHEIKEKNDWIGHLDNLLRTHELVPPSVIINKMNALCNDLPSNDVLRARISYYRKKRVNSYKCVSD